MRTEVETCLHRLNDLGFDHFIFLERNYLRKLASHIVATQRQAFHVKLGARVQHNKIHINPAKIYVGHRHATLLEIFGQYRQYFQRAQEAVAGSEILHLRYEVDIQTDPVVAVREACRFLDVAEHRPIINYGKTNDVPLSEIIENFDEIMDIVINSEFHDEAEDLLMVA